ncbi:hypothetical protein L618_005600000070 [Rhodococcus rhodochrous J45]|uniref:Uncharacterized protein n=1 Tax=Rhodococcus rhodochrous J45 TaxID=935266 RepID=A0A562DIC6_RHORH|nr:hypothetical protein L618_005600000070 [Rhodococcus rhodochrous J45]
MKLTLNNGVEMPALGFGVSNTPPAQTVAEAPQIGYQLIDTATSYFNEKEVCDTEAVTREAFWRDIPET